MELKCPICNKTYKVDLGSETFYCEKCRTSFSTARCYYQQRNSDENYLIIKGILYAYQGEKSEIEIPSEVNQIASGCFADNQLIEKVTIPSSVKRIEAHAFANCRNLTSVTLPEELRYIGLACFADCVKLQKIYVYSDTRVECSAFLRCTGLKASFYDANSIKSPSFVGLTDAQIEYRSGCYITSAVCEYRGEADDCEMLTRFRAFRDNWLAGQPGGKEDIEEYYRTAPAIVAAIHAQSACEEILDGIYHKYLKPCFELLDQGNLEGCREVYTRMVKTCEERYLQAK